MLPDDALAELDRETLEAGQADIPSAMLDAPEDALAERDAELRSLRQEPANDAERQADIDDLRAKYDGA